MSEVWNTEVDLGPIRRTPTSSTSMKCLLGHFKEVLQRENQGLKVYPVHRSEVLGMTGTSF